MKKSGPSSSLGSHIIDTKFVLAHSIIERQKDHHHHHAARRHHQRHKAKHKKAAAAAHDATTTEIEEAATQNRCGRESIAFARDFGREKKGR